MIILELLLKLTNIVPTSVNQDGTNNFYESKRARASAVPALSIRVGRCASGSGGVPPQSIRVGRSTPFRSEYKAVVCWSRFTALLRKKSNPYRRRDRRRRSLSGCSVLTYHNSRPETSACFIIIIPELLLKLTNIVPTSVTKTEPTISTKVSEHAPVDFLRYLI